MSLPAMVTQLCAIESALTMTNGYPIRARDLDDTPAKLNRGDCPQIVHLPSPVKDAHIAFASAGGGQKGRQDFVIVAYLFDQSESLDIVWESRPRVVQFVDDFVTALHNNPTLNGTATWVNVKASITDAGVYDGIPYRGVKFEITGLLFT